MEPQELLRTTLEFNNGNAADQNVREKKGKKPIW